jgi:hypothetical protein
MGGLSHPHALPLSHETGRTQKLVCYSPENRSPTFEPVAFNIFRLGYDEDIRVVVQLISTLTILTSRLLCLPVTL